MQFPSFSVLAATLAFVAPAGHALGQTAIPVSFHVSIGALDLKSNSYGYDGGALSAQLIINTKSPVINYGLNIDLGANWSLKLDGSSAFKGSSNLANYGWDPSFNTSTAFDDWSYYSYAAKTDLNHYFSGTLTLGRDIPINESFTVNLNGGLKYTDAKWSGTGGGYVYSTTTFRDTVGSFAPDVALINFRQQIPMAFGGIDLTFKQAAWTFTFGAKGGATFDHETTDERTRIGEKYVSQLSSAAVVLLNGRVEYAFNKNSKIFIAGTYDHVFKSRGDLHYYDMTSGSTAIFADSTGSDFKAGTITVGYKGSF